MKTRGIFFAGLLLLATACSSDETDAIIGLNENIHHDDFEYAVTAYEISQQIGSEQDELFTEGHYYLVHFRVQNKALRVDHKWDNSIAFLTDSIGTVYENSEDAQRKLNDVDDFGWKFSYKTTAGHTDSTILVFELPKELKEPYLMVRGETLMGDFFDGKKFKRTRIQLFR